MQSIIIRDAIQAILFGIVLVIFYSISGRFGSPMDMNLVAKTFVTFTGIYFVLSLVLDLIFKRNRK